MGIQYIEDPQTKQRIPFEWNQSTPPTSSDIESLFQASRKNQPVKKEAPKASTKKGNKALRAIGTTASGFNKGAANIAGFPVDIVNMGLTALGLPTSEKPLLGSQWIQDHLLPEPIKPVTKTEVALNALGEQVPAVMPGVGVAARLGQVRNALMAGGKFATGAGLASGAARNIAPDNPYYDIGAQIAGGLTVTGAVPAVNALTKIGGGRAAAKKSFEKMVEKKAGQRLLAARSTDPAVVAQIDKNAEMAEILEKEIPGLRLNLGQAGGDPNLLSLARQSGQMPGVGTSASAESVMNQNQAITDYIGKNITGKGNVDDFVSSIQQKKTDLALKTEQAGKAAESEAVKLSGRSDQDTGANLLEIAKKGRAESSKKAKELYAAVPDSLQVNSTPLWNKVNDLFGDFDTFTQRLSATPHNEASRVMKALEPKPSALIDPTTNAPFKATAPEKMTMKQLKDFRSQMGAVARNARASGDYELAYKADQLKYGVNETLDLAAKSGKGEAVESLKAATNYYRDVHVPTYRQGTTGKILASTRTGEQKVLDSSIGGEYFKPGKGASEAADSFKLTFGKNPGAVELIKDYASQSLLRAARNPVTGELETKRIQQWLYSHNTALKKYGLDKEFGSLQKAMKAADDAKGAEYAFNKSALARALNVDPDKAISEALMTGTGRKQSISRLKEMVSVARQDKTGAALAGLKAGIGDYFQKNTNLVARDLAEKKMDSLAKMDKFMDAYRPALKTSGLYTPQELSAFDNVHSAILKISQQSRPHPGFSGSPTFELISRLASTTATAATGHSVLYGAAKSLISFMEKPINEAVTRAVFDPRYADAIMRLARQTKTIGPEKAARSFTRRIAMFGQIATKVTANNED